jgi:stress-induced morphogen
MPSTDDLKHRIEAAIPGATADVTDLTGGGDHFRATVYAVFGPEIGGPIHALSLVTKAE